MKNITVSVPDDVYRKARIRAAERDTSVSSLVCKLLTQISGEESEFERLERQQEEVIDSIRGFSAADRLTRDEVHDRDALRRLESAAVRNQ